MKNLQTDYLIIILLSKMEPPYLIYVKGVGYTEEELATMIHYYKTNVILPNNIPSLNNDVIREIMLRATSNTLKNLALTNKVAHSFCNDAQFWQDKFTYYVLPQLVVIKECKKAVSVPRKMLQLPNNINNWMKAYIKMLEAHQLAIKLVNNILDTKKFKNFLIGGQGARQMHWLPPNIIDTLIDKYHKWYSLGFKIEFINEPMYYIQINGLGHQCSKQEFINYITLLIYYSNKNLSFENDKEDMWLYISDLQTHTDYIKSIFPNW